MFNSAPSPLTRRVRGSHSTRVKNPNPGYEIPGSHRKRLAFIRDLVEASQIRDVTRSDEAIWARTTSTRKKHFYADRVKSICALHTVFSEHVNLVTHDIEISIRNASDAAGLTTVSDAELEKAKNDPTYTPKVSISRASRAFHDMIELGWILADEKWQVWDKEAGQWIDKVFQATPLFFNAAGITTERIEKQQQMRLGYLKNQALQQGHTPEQVGRMSVTEIRQHRRQQWRKNAFERRSNEASRKKIKRELNEKDRNEQRQVATRRVLNQLDGEIVDLPLFKKLVNKEIAMLRKFAQLEPPPD